MQLLQDLAALSDFKLAQPVSIMKSGALRKKAEIKIWPLKINIPSVAIDDCATMVT